LNIQRSGQSAAQRNKKFPWTPRSLLEAVGSIKELTANRFKVPSQENPFTAAMQYNKYHGTMAYEISNHGMNKDPRPGMFLLAKYIARGDTLQRKYT